ncbi:MAG TPA: ADOP family duplicated permease, partial [Longimicrobiaceae bacterium]|nr:ADOP family duplicated permease [Longimicrobiaceae bacterium]
VFRLGVERGETAEELAFHREQTREELVAGGLSAEEADAEARRRFGDERHWRKEIEAVDRGTERRRRWGEGWEVVQQSIRLALRRMRRERGFTAAVVLTFALGIGANATMFGIVDRLLLTPPAHVTHPEQVKRLLVEQRNRFTDSRTPTDVIAYPDYEAMAKAKGLSAVAVVSNREITVGRGQNASRHNADLVTGDFFSLLGVRPEMGRFFGPAEDRIGGPSVAVISHGMWQRVYGGRHDVLGRILDLPTGQYTIIGVAPEGFTGMDLRHVDLWLPLLPTAYRTNPYCIETGNCNWLRAVARLAPGATPEAAAAEASGLLLQSRHEDIEAGHYDAKARVIAAPLMAARGPLASKESRVARWLAGISLLVLLIACANIANLLLARATRQEREMGVRLALGSSRARVLGQVLAESLLLSLLGGAAAVLLTYWGGAALRNVLLPGITWEEPGLELRMVGVVLALALLAGLVAGVIPAFQSSRSDLAEVLKGNSRTTSTPTSRVRATLTVMLLVGAGLFVRSLHRATTLDLGIDPRGVLLVNPVFNDGVPDAQQAEFYRNAAERLTSLPGVEAVSVDASIPFFSQIAVSLRTPELDSLPSLPSGSPVLHVVGRDYFRVLRLHIDRGRGFSPDDGMGTAPVVLVNETMARMVWPSESALGKCLIVGDNPNDADVPPCATVIGVVENAHRFSLEEGEAMQYYLLADQDTDSNPNGLLVRIRGELGTMTPAIQRELLSLDPQLRFINAQPLQKLLDPQFGTWRLGAVVFTAFGLLALLVAAVGLYGVLAFSVAQRTFELGIRSALGASRERLLGLVLSQALRLVVIGVVLGVVAALLAGRWMEPLLFHTSPRDPLVLGGVAGALLLVGVLASWLPARRATRVDPMVALRSE